MFHISSNGISFLKEKEGFRSNAYYDSAGVLTIGYGHSAYAPSIAEYPVYPGQHISESEGENILRADLKPTESVVNSALKRNITQNQYDALVSFTFNLGAGAFRSSDVLAYTNQGNYQAAADALLEYSHAGGVFLQGLYKRRSEERAMYLSSLPDGSNTAQSQDSNRSARIDALISWFEERKGKVSYILGARGPYAYDCSSSVYAALRYAGFVPAGTDGYTDTLFAHLSQNGWSRVPHNSDGSFTIHRGDIFIWGVEGASAGAAGHTGVVYDESEHIIHCSYSANGISITNHDTTWEGADKPPVTFFRYTASGTPFPIGDKGHSTNPYIQYSPGKLHPYSGVFYCGQKLAVSADTDPASPALAYYNSGDSVIYDSYIFENGYAWISYISYQGHRRYIAVGPDDGNPNTVWGSGFLNAVVSAGRLIPHNGVFTPAIQLPISNDTRVSSPAVGYYSPGQSVRYDSYTSANGYVWISYISYQGHRRYIAVGPDDGNPNTVWGSGFFTPNNTGTSQLNGYGAYLVPKYGMFTPNRQLPVSADTNPSSPALAYYQPGNSVYYDSYILANGYYWISYVSSGGNRRYIAVGPNDGNPSNTWGIGFYN